MTTLQRQGLEKVIRTWCPSWSDQDNQGWLRHWKAHAPGGPTLEDLVATPIKTEWQLACKLWVRTGPNHPSVTILQLITGGPEAVLCHNERIYRGAPLAISGVAIPRQSVQPQA